MKVNISGTGNELCVSEMEVGKHLLLILPFTCPIAWEDSESPGIHQYYAQVALQYQKMEQQKKKDPRAAQGFRTFVYSEHKRRWSTVSYELKLVLGTVSS